VSDPDAPVALYIAAYADASAAQTDWDALKQAESTGAIDIDGMVLVSRDQDGKVDVKDTDHTTAKGTGWGALGGAVVGLLFPPALLGATVVGAAAGAGIGGLKSHSDKQQIKEDAEEVLPDNSSGIIAEVEPQFAQQFQAAMTNATKVTQREVDSDSAGEVKKKAQSS
jgi:uncharacterized membrane protein